MEREREIITRGNDNQCKSLTTYHGAVLTSGDLEAGMT